MNITLLDKTRKINSLLRSISTTKVVFNDICNVLSDTLGANVFVISRKGKILGVSDTRGMTEDIQLIEGEVGDLIDPLFNERLLSILSTKENVNLGILGFEENTEGLFAVVNPIEIAGERLGTVFSYRRERMFDIEDVIVSEYGTTVVALAMVRSVDEESEEEQRQIRIVQSAFSSLSYSEQEAILHVFEELGGKEGILVASRIADRIGITRSIIVNALRKFESAGVISSRSSGMKGTYIKVQNDYVFQEIEKIRKKRSKKA